MAATIVNRNHNNSIHQPILYDAQLFSAPDLDDTTDVDGTTVVEKESSKVSAVNQPASEVSTNVSSMRKFRTRTYKYVELERALRAADLLKTEEQRMEFNFDYLESLRENKFDEFIEIYYQKIRDHFDKIKQNQEIEKARVFTFFDLEKNFLALDPTRDVKILFLDETPTASTITKTSRARSAGSAPQRVLSASAATDAAVENFYGRRAKHLMKDQSKARDEITLFARRTAERLHERLPCLTTMPHRVKIVDNRDLTNQTNEQILLQIKHKRALAIINKRRNIIWKMISQTKKNQMKIEQHQRNATPIGIDSVACCKELLERANQIDPMPKENRIHQRPQTATVPRRIPSTKTSSTLSDVSTKTDSSNSVVPFQDSLSITQIEQAKNVRILRPTRPLTAPTKVNWINYC